LGKYGKTALSVGIMGAGIASGAGWFTGAFWKQAGLMAVSSVLGSLQHQDGPRQSNMSVQLAQEGADLPRGWGRWRQAGTLVWCPGLDEHRQSHSAGKGGPKITEFKYSASAMIVVGRGPITRVERIRLNERVVYDYAGGVEKGFKLLVQGDASSGAWKWVKNGDGRVRIYPGTLNQPVDSWLQAAKGLGQWTNYPGLWGAFFENCNLDKYDGHLPTATFDVYNAQTDLAEVVREICGLRGLTDDELDLDELAGQSIAQSEDEGYVLASRRAASDALAELGFLFNFTLRECNGVLQAIRRGRVSVAVISGREATVGTENAPTLPLEERWLDANELPMVEECGFGDAGREGNPGVRRALRSDAPDPAPVGARGGRREQQTVTAQLRGGRALRAAQIRLGERWAAREGYALSLSPRFLRLAAGDEITLLTGNGPRTLSLPKLDEPFFGPIGATSQGINRALYGLPIPGDGGYDIESPFPDSPETPIGFAVDCVAVGSDRPDTVSKAGLLFAATQISGRTWRGVECNVEYPKDSQNDGLGGTVDTGTWKKDYDVTIQARATMGYLRAPWTPSRPENGVTDSSSASDPLPAKLYYGEMHALAPGAPARANILVFQSGLVVRFKNAVQVGADLLALDLSGLECGIWGSDYAEAGIENRTANGTRSGLQLGTGTKFLLLYDEEGERTSGWDWTGFDASIIGKARRLTFWPHDVDEPWNHQMSFVFAPVRGRNIEPIAPAWESASRSDDGTVFLSGHARTRYVEANTDNPTRLSERPSASGFRFQVTFSSGSATGTAEIVSTDPLAHFGWSLSAARIGAIVGRSAGDVAANALSGSVALWSDATGFGRRSLFSFPAPPPPAPPPAP